MDNMEIKEEFGGVEEDEIGVDANAILQAINGATTSAERSSKRQRQRRGNRMKVYDNGYIFTYDKDSQCGQRSFWRCERKSECQARVHTNPNNQIIKRINEHTHEPPKNEELPPWLVLSQTHSDTEDGMGKESTTGILINANYSTNANTQLAKIIRKELDQAEDGESNLPCVSDVFTSSLNPVAEVFIPESLPEKINSFTPVKKKKKAVKEEAEGYDPSWEEVVVATKKIIKFVKSGQAIPSVSFRCNSNLNIFLDENNLSEYAYRLSKYSMEKLRLLSLSDCCTLIGNEHDGLLLYHSLQQSSCDVPTSSSATNSLTLYLAEGCSITNDEDDPLYKMICLSEKTPNELGREMEQLDLIPPGKSLMLCVEGPNKIKVELNEKIMSTWPNQSILRFFIQKGVCLLRKVS